MENNQKVVNLYNEVSKIFGMWEYDETKHMIANFRDQDGHNHIVVSPIDGEGAMDVKTFIRNTYTNIFGTGHQCWNLSQWLKDLGVSTCGGDSRITFITILSIVRTLFPYNNDFGALSKFFYVWMYKMKEEINNNINSNNDYKLTTTEEFRNGCRVTVSVNKK